jgi:septum site-determining protein MinD
MLAVVGGKGGSGKTTTTLCLARALASREGSALVVDADVDMPDLHTVAGTSRDLGVDAVASGTPVDESSHRSLAFPGVDVLSAPTDSRAIARVASVLDSRPEPILIDTPAGASRDVTRALRIADRSLVVTTPTRESLADAAKSVELARALDVPPIGTVVTRSDGTVDPEPLLGCPTLTHVPSATDPPGNRSVRTAYADCLPLGTKRNV